MFDRFLDLQQEKLEQLGVDKQTRQTRHELEQQRYDSLKFFVDSMAHHETGSALYHRNRLAMKKQLGTLLDSQEQELLVAGLELDASRKALLAQYGKVKGLKSLKGRRDLQQRRRDKRAEQHQQDDWINGARRKD